MSTIRLLDFTQLSSVVKLSSFRNGMCERISNTLRGVGRGANRRPQLQTVGRDTAASADDHEQSDTLVSCQTSDGNFCSMNFWWGCAMACTEISCWSFPIFVIQFWGSAVCDVRLNLSNEYGAVTRSFECSLWQKIIDFSHSWSVFWTLNQF